MTDAAVLCVDDCGINDEDEIGACFTFDCTMEDVSNGAVWTVEVFEDCAVP